MLKVKFRKVKNSHNRLRDNEILGKCTHIPEIGHQFLMFAESRDLKSEDIPEGAIGFHQVNTSLIESCVYNYDTKTFTISTESGSIYEIEVLDDKDPFEYKRHDKRGIH